MHEMSIIESLVEAVNKERQAYPGAQVIAVRVRVGALRLVVPEVMESCYAAATLDTPLEGSRLELEQVAATARCGQCAHEFVVEENWFECPNCHACGGELLTGQELDLTSIELEHAAPVTSCPTEGGSIDKMSSPASGIGSPADAQPALGQEVAKA